MASQQSSSLQKQKPLLYPQVLESNPDLHSPFLSTASTKPNSSSSSSLYPSLDGPNAAKPHPDLTSASSSLYPSLSMKDLVENLFPDSADNDNTAADCPPPLEETLIRVPGAILHLIDRHRSVQLAAGDFSVVRLRQGDNTVAVLARLGLGDDRVQWPLARDGAAVKLDDSHYFFALHVPPSSADDDDDDAAGGGGDGSENLLNYGLTFASKGQEDSLKGLDGILEEYCSFSIQKIEPKGGKEAGGAAQVVDGSVERQVTPAEVMGPKKEMMEERSAAYWTTLAPNVEEYGSTMARLVAKGSGKLIQGILWCGDVTVDQLKWGEGVLRRRMEPCSKPAEVSKDALKRMKRVKKMTKMSEKVANGILSGVLKVSGFFTSSIVNSAPGKKFFSLLPGEVILASLDGFGKICDAVEIAGKNVLQTSSVVTTSLVSHSHGEPAAEITRESLDAAGHAFGTAWTVFKIRKALNPKNAMKSKTLAVEGAKAAAADLKAKKEKEKRKK